MNTQTLNFKRGTFNQNYPVNQIVYSTVNRDIVEKHSEAFAKKVVDFGWLSPIVIDEKGNLIEGHNRVEMARQNNITSVPAYIVDWVDTSNLDEYQKYIINLNNANRPWTALDYLKTFSQTRKEYSTVYKIYNETKDVFSVGNVLNIYFNSGSNMVFKDGRATIKDLPFSMYLHKKFYEMKKHYGGIKIQAFTINRVCSFAHQKIKGNLSEMKYIFDQLEQLAENDSPVLSSVEHIRPFVNKQLKLYREIKND